MSLPKEAIVPEHFVQAIAVFENPELANIGILVKFLGFRPYTGKVRLIFL
jgi:hypothetical protein